MKYLLVLLAACANLPEVGSGVCGNGVIEAGEDCDVSDTRCQACAWSCEPVVGCANLPAPRTAGAYRCGVDNLCHAPSGTFGAVAASEQPFQVDRFVVADVDRDGIGDAVGLSSTSITTRFGDAKAALATTTSAVTPDITGLAAVADIDGDGTPDYVLPTADGVVAFSSANQVVAPYALSIALPAPFSTIDTLSAFALDDVHFGVIVALPGGGIIGAALDTTRLPPRAQILTLCDGITATGYAPGRFQVYDSTAATGNRSAVITFATQNATGVAQCTVGVTVLPALPGQLAVVTSAVLSSLSAPASAVLLDRDGDRCPSLVVADAGIASAHEYAGTRDATGACKLAAAGAALPAFPAAGPGESLVGRAALRPVAAGLAPDALVTTHGIYGVGASAYQLLYASDRVLDSVQFGDFDADGATDVAVSSSTEPDLDVLYRTTSAAPTFLRRRVATDAPPAHVVVDDFDGNGAADIAYAETIGSGARMSAAYGDPTRTLTAVAVGEYTDVRAVAPIHLVASNSPNNVLGDLALADARTPDDVRIDLLYGSPERTLLPFLDPDVTHRSTFRSVVSGSFVSPTSTDIIAFELPDDRATSPFPSLQMLAGGGGSVDLAAPSSSQAMLGIDTCDATVVAFCLDDARLVAWPTSDHHDLVVAIDPRTKNTFTIDPMIPFTCGMGGMAPCQLPMVPDPLLGSTIAQAPVVFDVDGDGVAELVIGSSTGIESCAVGDALSCHALAVPDLDATCTAAVVGRVDPAGDPALVLACGTKLYRYANGTATLLVTLAEPPREVELGDVTGDGLDDLLVTTTTSTGAALLVYPQRTSREAP